MWIKDRQLRLRISRSVCVGLLLAWPASVWSQTVTATISVGTAPEGVAVNKTTNKIYVANYLSANVTVIDGTTNSTTTVEAAFHPAAVAVNEATNKIYVANVGFGGPFGNGDRGSVTVIDGATNQTTTVVDPNANGPRAVAVNSATNKVYVANLWTGNVTVIDGATNSTTTVTDPNAGANGLGAIALAVNPTTNKVYVANGFCALLGGCSNPGNVTVIDGTANSTTTISDPNAISPNSVAVNTVTNQIYVANEGNYPGSNHGNVTVIDGATNSVTTLTDSNALAPVGVAVNQTANKIYVANANDSAVTGNGGVTVIDGATNSLSFVSAGPNSHILHAVALDSVTNTIYVTSEGCFQEDPCRNPGSVTVINGATNAVTTIINASAHNPEGVAVNEMNNRIYVANTGSSNVTVIDGGAIPTSHTLSVVQEGSGSGTVTSNPTGINCGTSCAASFSPGTTVSLAASPAPGSQFSGWTANCTRMGSCNVTLTTSDEFVTATFNGTSSPPDFSITPASASLTAQRGGQVTDVISIAPLNGSFSNTVQLICAVTGTTPLATCSLSATSVTPGANSVTSTLTITAPTQSARLNPSGDVQLSGPLYAVFLPITLALIGYGLRPKKSKRRQFWLLCGLFIALVALQAGCGGGSSNPPPPRALNYTVTVTATSGTIQHTTQVTVTVP
jgi:DNA-binding beta-propeller fold protein YncE